MSEELNAAIAEVSAAAQTELSDAEPEVTSESTTEPTSEPEVKTEETTTEETEAEVTEPEKTEEPDKAAEPAEEPDEPEGEDTLGLSTDTLKAINDNPELSAVYKKMQAGQTKAFQENAEDRKLAKVARWMRENPDDALDELARLRGRTLDGQAPEKPKDPDVAEVTDELGKKWEEKLGPKASAILKPLIEETIERVSSRLLETKIKPVQDEAKILTDAATATGIKSAVTAFGLSKQQDGLDWSTEIAKGMGDAMTFIHPTDEATSDQYLDVLYNHATTGINRTASRRTELRRLKAAKAEAEPTTTVRPKSPGVARITADMNDNDSVAAAVAMAQKEITG